MENKLANPAPLGLLGFGMTTILLNIHNLGFFPVSAVIISMGIFYGGLAQIIAGILSYKNGKTFAGTAFTSYGFFWLTLVGVWLFPNTGFEMAGATPAPFFGCYLTFWGIFTAFMWWGTWGGSKVQQFVFLSLTVCRQTFFYFRHRFSIWPVVRPLGYSDSRVFPFHHR